VPPPFPVRLGLCSLLHVNATGGPPSQPSSSWTLASSTPRPLDRPTSVPLAPGHAAPSPARTAPGRAGSKPRHRAPAPSAAPEHPPGTEHRPQMPPSLCFVRALRHWTFPAFITIRSALHPTPPHSFLVEPCFGFRRSPGVCCIV
jgi:hypothetical protein